MESQLEEIREQQRQSWNKFSPGWKKWDELTMDFLYPMGARIIESLHPSGKDMVLDIAAGTGEPGLTIASMLDGGKVVITDLAEEMVSIARDNAKKRGITNADIITCDVSELPFDNDTFDAISCRFGFMFFPDMQLAANEMYRVLKPGGKMATSVWDIPEKNFWVTAIMGTINKNMELPLPPSGAPGMFRCCKPGLMKEILTKAGFRNIREEQITPILRSGNIETYWQMMTEVGAPIVAALNQADEPLRKKIKDEVFDLIRQKFPNGIVNLEGGAIVISAEKE